MSRSFDLIAHRGDPAHAPENTLTSLRQAIRKGATAVEVDVRRSGDGVWVVFHDPALKRLAGVKGRLSRTPWKALSKLEVEGEPIPSLEQVLELCTKEGVRLFLDVKLSSGEAALARLFLTKPAWQKRVWVGAGTQKSLKRWRGLLPETIPLFWVTGYRAPVTNLRIRQALRLRVDGLLVYKRWANRRAVERVHAAGLKLYVWTIRELSDFKRMKESGVDGVMSELWPHPSI